jgi:hypothetical protein
MTIWNDKDFQGIFKTELAEGVRTIERDVQGTEQKFHADVARSGGAIAGVHLVYAAGGIASSILTGYVNQALAAFDTALDATGAEPGEGDYEELRRQIRADLEQRFAGLPARLRAILKSDTDGAVWKLIASQSPANAHHQLDRRIDRDLKGVRYRRRQAEIAERAVFISHSAADKTLAKTLQRELKAFVGEDVEVFVSSDLSSIRGGADWKDRLMGRLRSCRVAVAIVTPNSIGRPWLHYEAGVVDGRERAVIPCVARGLRFKNLAPPLGIRHGRELGDQEAAEALFREVRAYLGLPELEDLPIVKATVEEARRPTLADSLSVLAISVCETISACSKRGDYTADDRIETEAFASEHKVGMPELLAVLGELENLGWIRADRMRLGPSGHIPRFFMPTSDFYLDTEAALGGDDPSHDARALAAAAVRSGDAAPACGALASSLGWDLRRTNLALHELKRHVADSPKGERMGQYVYLHLNVTLGLRAFARTEE